MTLDDIIARIDGMMRNHEAGALYDLAGIHWDLMELRKATTWSPIDSAPKDGTRVLVLYASVMGGHIAAIAAYDARSHLWFDPLAAFDPITNEVTAWMPLPSTEML